MWGLKQVKASAGSGKTFQLTNRFLSLLDGAEDDAHPFVCSSAPRGRYGWPEILAVTFTNKAAAEMKERIVQGLKKRALGLEAGNPARAGDILRSVLRRYQRLNVRTIDSLLNQLLRLFALEAEIPPDFELALEEDPLFNEMYAAFLDRCETGTHTGLEQAIRAMVDAEARTFWIQDTLQKDLLALIRFVRDLPRRPETDQKTVKARLAAARASMMQPLADLEAYVQELGLPLHANLIKAWAKVRGCSLFDSPPASKMFVRETLLESVKAAGISLVDERAEFLWLRFKNAFELHREEHGFLRQAYFLAPAVALALELVGEMERLQARRGVILNSFLPATINRLLSQGAVSEAFCRLGCRLHHLLVDEFQDTSRGQWSAVTPLAEECLAKGGSLFCVGDVKQAIYGWRGGDSALFDQVMTQAGLAELVEDRDREIETLPDNWRSFRKVVEFNNRFFERLENEDDGLELVEALFSKASDGFRRTLALEVNRAFSACSQGVPKKHRDTEGYVRFERLEAGDAEDIETMTLARLDGLLDELGGRRPWRDVAVLVRNHAHAKLVSDRLIERAIPVITEKSLRLNRHPVVRQVVAFLAFLDYPRNDHAFAEFAGGAELFLAEAGLTETEFTDWLITPSKHTLGARFKADFPETWARLVEPFFNRSGMMTPYDLARDIIDGFQVLARHPDAELYVQRLLEVIHLAENAGYGSLASFLEYWQAQGEAEKVPLPENVDAVRVMTVHKAKGLEFPVVIVPFHHWETRQSKEFLVKDNMVAKVRSELDIHYHRAKGEGALEDLNLVYVTWTRACEELYGFYVEKSPKSSAVTTALNLFLEPGDDGITEHGPCPVPGPVVAPAAPEPLPVVPPRQDSPELLAWLPRLRVYRHHQDEFGYNEARRGDVVHRAMEHLSTRPTPGHIPTAVAEALADFPLLGSLDPALRHRLESDMLEILAWALDHPQVGPWLASGANEREIMDPDGEVFRMDRLHQDTSGLWVIDWKTGQPDPKHLEQVRGYLELMAAAGAPGPLHGALVYLDLREVRPVEWPASGTKSGEGE